jgi:predicted CoA-substrate-specific enzyme activase
MNRLGCASDRTETLPALDHPSVPGGPVDAGKDQVGQPRNRSYGDAATVGVDIGAVFVKILLLDDRGCVRRTSMERHHGDPLSVAREGLRSFAEPGTVKVAVTGSGATLAADALGARVIDSVRAEIRAVQKHFPHVRNIINIGGGSLTLVQLDENGRFLDYNTNSLCAAGTGSFLDQQADRLGIDYDDLDSFRHVDDPPAIATRCSVFAKSDLIHRQQEGHGKEALWSGLCRSMIGTSLNTLLRGRELDALTVVTGGVSRNVEAMYWLRSRYGRLVQTYDLAPFSGAEGAALLCEDDAEQHRRSQTRVRTGSTGSTGSPIPSRTSCESCHEDNRMAGCNTEPYLSAVDGFGARGVSAAEDLRRPALALKRSRYPDFGADESFMDDDGNEVRVTGWPAENAPLRVAIGLDVGSTSTKAVLVDPSGKPVADIYRRTAGNPVEATQKLFAAIAQLADRRATPLVVAAVAVTGSGRKLVGEIVGADAVMNEITAHLEGALRTDPSVETIFEIGGQDAKYIHAREGRICDSNMNYVCAAGTGSFVEEQARRLGIPLEEIGATVMGLSPPVTSDRCTVFMEQDVDRLIRQGYTAAECMAAVLYSVVKNYLTKVVGRRHVSVDKIFFQGATARNRGLVAAFENLLDAEIVVSSHCHVMGAYGAALLAQKRLGVSGAESRFKGLDLYRRSIALRPETCSLCNNHCRITFADIAGENASPSWGYLCGRDPDDARVRPQREFAPVRKRLSLLTRVRDADVTGQVVGLPFCLTSYTYLPLWRAFFRELGVAVKLSPPTDEETIRRGTQLTAADFCFPIKVAHGTVDRLADDSEVDWIFLPHMIEAEKGAETAYSHFCPYVQAFPSVMRSVLRMRCRDARLLSPVISLKDGTRRILDALEESLDKPLGLDRARLKRAWGSAVAAQTSFAQDRRREGERVLREIVASGEKAIVLFGRPYNTLDFGANLSLPRKIANLGMRVIPVDMLPYSRCDLNPAFGTMYWEYGQHILCAAELVRDHPQLFGLYLTNFSCGPDSFLISFVERIMGRKPLLTVELDDHGGDAGYLTRVEAFLDVVNSWQPVEQPSFRVARPPESRTAFEGRKLWVPAMHPYSAELFAAVLRGAGYAAERLPIEDAEAHELGRSVTRGSECLPAALTIGAFLKAVRSDGQDKHALFMPSATGPCRFGMYTTLQRLLFNELGMGDVPILSPSAENAYQGLTRPVLTRIWEASAVGAALGKCRDKLRPYGVEKGRVDTFFESACRRLSETFEEGESARECLAELVGEMLQLPVADVGSKPLVGIVGEIYVRSNPFSNDDLLRSIEAAGGEAWLAPVTEWVLYSAELEGIKVCRRRFNGLQRLAVHLKNRFFERTEAAIQEITSPILHDRREPHVKQILEEGKRFLPIEFGGEAILTMGRSRIFERDGAVLVVNASPFGCMPGTITSALLRELQTRIGIPIVNMFYDGEPGINDRLAVYLNNLGVGQAARSRV